MTPAIIGPVPPYSNVPIAPQNYKPSRFVISSITLGQNTTVTTTVNNNYALGQLVRLLIPLSFGSIQLNEQTGSVIDIPASNQVTLNINSSQNVDAFVSSVATTKAQIVAVGDYNNGTTNANGRTQVSNVVPGSFINISP